MMNMKAAICIASQKELRSISVNINLNHTSYIAIPSLSAILKTATYTAIVKYVILWISLSLTQKLKNNTGIIGDGMGIK